MLTGKRSTIFFTLALMSVIIMMIVPVPSWLLDIGLATSFALAILVFAVAVFIEMPLQFSAFPTVLLASLMLRLSLNVSSTKLIIGHGHTGPDAAGHVIEGFANFIMSGNIVLGLVVFCVLLIVNFVVITKGATRMAEVGARFALDAMPGKQMAIDSDLAAGAINHDEARERREREHDETTFLGSLDGASKFVKGDAIAGLLITGLNLIVGLATGVVGQAMPIGLAFETYAILTVGDGLVSQIPGVILSIAAALLLSRGGVTGSADTAVFKQLGQSPQALVTVGALLAVFGFVPGMPFVPFTGGALLLGLAAYLKLKPFQGNEISNPDKVNDTPDRNSLADILELDDIRLRFSGDLVELILDNATGLDARIGNMRTYLAESFGFLLPEIRLSDDPGLPDQTYAIDILGVEQTRATLMPGSVLAIASGKDDLNVLDGYPVSEPVYGADAIWIDPQQRERALLEGITTVAPAEVLATHLLEITKKNFSRLLSIRSVHRLLDEMIKTSNPQKAEANRRLLDDLVPEKITVPMLHSLLKLLLEEQVSIRNLPAILEVASTVVAVSQSAEQMCEAVRVSLGYQLVSELKRDDGSVPLLQLSSEWEEIFRNYQTERLESTASVALPSDLIGKLTNRIASALNTSVTARALIAPPGRRRFLRSVLHAHGIHIPVLSFEEIGTEATPALVGVVPV